MNRTKTIKITSCIRRASGSAILAGMIVLFIGIYYYAIKAGIPYQDPTLELQIQYAVHMGIGRILVKNGLGITICAGMVHLFSYLTLKKFVSGPNQDLS